MVWEDNMDFLKGVFNTLADPRLFFLLARAALGAADLEARARGVERVRLRPARRAGGCSSSFGALRPELPADRHQAGQRADRGLIFLLVFF